MFQTDLESDYQQFFPSAFPVNYFKSFMCKVQQIIE